MQQKESFTTQHVLDKINIHIIGDASVPCSKKKKNYTARVSKMGQIA
jgi:hypothetical protein